MGKPPARPKAPRAPKAADRLAALEAQVTALTERVAALESSAVQPGAPTGIPERAKRVEGRAAESKGEAKGEAIRSAVLAAVGALDTKHRYGGIVPIPDVRAELRRGGIHDDAAVTAALEALERAWKIDLSVAQSPTQVADRAAGIERPGRGLLYYVARR